MLLDNIGINSKRISTRFNSLFGVLLVREVDIGLVFCRHRLGSFLERCGNFTDVRKDEIWLDVLDFDIFRFTDPREDKDGV